MARRSVFRSGRTGKFVRRAYARRHPTTTTRQSVPSRSKGSYRSLKNGRYVTKTTAQRHPASTMHEG